ncbi:SigE family RNA polymerase sigma factor [Dactylosporangium aurantiacum]|uniref:SigE family RNA polymerase sigma factor n=1 Tax=Dactylosporangium aurantiacum TaxID=35754 RepID=A0A9Q9IEL5_9ACTN|nr:SigE family RNA polymerase sigma factor [Dactylosporangium aurantiacum]MDG6110157.1 SigE family RNA polymerase sigma factor [Dactylosporangium aurantiacum]UWZ54647.1 SigE family RNA polymerase sigma factor [Dactylosporangium aurantiacum]
MATDQAYREYVAGNLDRLRKTAYLLCGDWHLADDLTSTVLVKLLRHWKRATVMEHRDAYVRRMLMSAWLDERRRPWRRESSTDRLPDRAVAVTDADQRLDVRSLLAGLPPRRRAVLVLRYFCDLSVEETAQALGCSEGTVKSQAARALESLRAGLREGDPLWI